MISPSRFDGVESSKRPVACERWRGGQPKAMPGVSLQPCELGSWAIFAARLLSLRSGRELEEEEEEGCSSLASGALAFFFFPFQEPRAAFPAADVAWLLSRAPPAAAGAAAGLSSWCARAGAAATEEPAEISRCGPCSHRSGERRQRASSGCCEICSPGCSVGIAARPAREILGVWLAVGAVPHPLPGPTRHLPSPHPCGARRHHRGTGSLAGSEVLTRSLSLSSLLPGAPQTRGPSRGDAQQQLCVPPAGASLSPSPPWTLR